MANKTTNYNLNKPLKNENVNIDVLNQNMDIIDAELKAISDKASDLTALNNHINNKTNPHEVTKSQIGLENVENKSSATIRGEITKENVVNALGYVPPSESTIQTKISEHDASTTAHTDIRDLIAGLTNRLNALADSDDTTLDQLSEIVAYIKSNRSLIGSVTTNKINVSDIINSLTSTSIDKPLAANQGKVLKGLIDTLVSSFNTHKDDTTVHINSTERANFTDAYNKRHTHSNKPIIDGITSTLVDNWNSAKTHADSAHAPSNAEANVIETVKVNGSALTSSSKAVNVTVPTKVSQLTNDSGYKTTDNNTTYSLSKSGSTITLTGSDGSKTSVTDSSASATYGVATTSTLGLVKSGTDITVDSSGNVSVNDDSHNHVISNVDGLQSALDAKLSHFTITTGDTDFNTLKTTGVYHIRTSSGKNRPTSNHGVLYVDFTIGTPFQLWIPDVQNNMYKRTYASSTWTSWAVLKLTNVCTLVYSSTEPTSNLDANMVWIG